MTFEEIETREKAKPLLFFKRKPPNIQIQSLEEFVKLLIQKYVKSRETQELTPQGIQKQCDKNRGRSFGDLYRIILSYYPDAKVKEVYQILDKLLKAKEIYSIKCGTINKRTYHWHSHYGCYLNDSDEYNNIFKDLPLDE